MNPNDKQLTMKKINIPTKNIVLSILFLGLILYIIISPKIIISPTIEAERMARLEKTKEEFDLVPFVTDGCSGDISKNWTLVVETISGFSKDFAEKYSDQRNIPIESACVRHDAEYHRGEGGYAARLKADIQLRSDIMEYGMQNWQEIVEKTPLKTEEEVIFAFEKIAGIIYRGVRLGGSPCSGQPYAWGYGYNGGFCVAN